MSAWQVIRRGVKWLVRLRPATVHAGPGSGLKVFMRRASGAFDLGTSEMPVQDWIVRHLRPGGVFFDVGANIGFFSLLAARAVGAQGRVFAFEPVPENADWVRRNATLNGFEHVHVFDVAVSSSTGETDLVIAEHPGGASLKIAATPPDAKQVVRVKTVTLDAMVEREGLPPPSVVKIDVEGAELRVLEGMARLTKAHRPKIVCEVDAARPSDAEDSAVKAETMMREWGYTTSRLMNSYPGREWTVIHIVGE